MTVKLLIPDKVLHGDVLTSDEITVSIRPNPFLIDSISLRRPAGMSVSEIIESAGSLVPAGFQLFGEVDIDGHWVPREVWHVVRPKPPETGEVARVVSLKMVPRGGGSGKLTSKNVLQIVGAIAVLGAVALTGGGALVPILGSGFAAGTFGAQAAAAAVGTIGVLALQALSPAPVAAEDAAGPGALDSQSNTGVSVNALKPLDYLSVVLGKLHVAPPRLTPAFTELVGQIVRVTAVVGIAGEYDIDDIRVNNIAVAEFDGLEYEVLNGTLTDGLLTIGNVTVIEDNNRNVELPNFHTKPKSNESQKLYHQTDDGEDPNLDLPKWKNFVTRGQPEEIWLRYVWPSGQVQTDNGAQIATPFNIEIRQYGTSTWHKLPVVYAQDLSAGKKQQRHHIVLQRGHLDMAVTDIIPYDTNVNGFDLAHAHLALGTSWQYVTEPEYWPTPLLYPLTSNSTPGSSVVLTPSTESGGSEAWRAFDTSTDNFSGSFWGPTGSFPHTLLMDYGLNNKVIILSYAFKINSNNLNTAPRDWTLQRSDDNVNWIVADTRSGQSGYNSRIFSPVNGDAQHARYWRFVFTAGNGSNPNLVHIRLSQFIEGSSFANTDVRATQTALIEDGIVIYLDPDKFPLGFDYEVRTRRGFSINPNNFNELTGNYNGSTDNAKWFSIHKNGTSDEVYDDQENRSSQVFLEIFSSYKNVYPMNLDGIKVALIAVRTSQATIESISATFTSRVPIWNGTDWDTVVGSQNGAALFRHVLTGSENSKPLPLQAIDDVSLAYAYDFCQTNGIEVNLLIEGGPSIEDVVQRIASAMFAFVARSSKWGLVIDESRQNEIISQNFTPINSKSLAIDVDYADLPHALYVQYVDEGQDYDTKFTTVFMDGYNGDGSGGLTAAVNYDSIKYDGITTLAGVQARALYDMRVAWYRMARYRLTIGIENLQTSRGRLVGLTHDILTNRSAFTLTTGKIIDGSNNVIGLELEDIELAEEVFNDAFAPANIFAEADVFNIQVDLGAAITQNDGTVIVKEIATVDPTSKEITFASPWTDDNKIGEGFVVGIGPLGQEHVRCLVSGVERANDMEATITLVDEAPQIHADPS